MTEPNTPIDGTPALTTAARFGWGLLILATLYICYFAHLGALGFIGPDEPRYAWIARDMAETGDWITPRLYGKPWFEKPPLYYWGAALSFKMFGVSETAARLPSAIFALLATLALGWLALRVYGSETARWLLLLLPTTTGMIGFSHAAATDMPFSSMLSIAMVCAAVVLGLTRNEHSPVLPRTPWLALLLFGFFLGLAVLAKGPAAIILSGGAVFFWALFTKRWRDAFRLLHPAAIAAFCLTALPWYILCARRNPDFFRVFIIEHNFKRYLTPEFQHVQPFWFYAPVLLVAFLPWSAIFLWSLFSGVTHLWRTRCTKESTWLLLCWAGFCVLFFSLSQSKLPGYILPAIPAIGLILAHSLTGIARLQPKSFRATLWLAALIFFLLFSVVALLAPHLSRENEKFGTGVAAVLALMGAANFVLAFFSRPESGQSPTRVRAAFCGLPALFAVMLTYFLLPSFFRFDPSGRTIARELQFRKIPKDKLAVGWMNRGQHYSLNFYLHAEIKDWSQDHSTNEYVVTDTSGCRNLNPVPLACEEISFDTQSTGAFLYRVVTAGSAEGLAGGRQLR